MTKEKIISRAISTRHTERMNTEIDRCLEKIDDIRKYPDKYPAGALRAAEEHLKEIQYGCCRL